MGPLNEEVQHQQQSGVWHFYHWICISLSILLWVNASGSFCCIYTHTVNVSNSHNFTQKRKDNNLIDNNNWDRYPRRLNILCDITNGWFFRTRVDSFLGSSLPGYTDTDCCLETLVKGILHKMDLCLFFLSCLCLSAHHVVTKRRCFMRLF